MIRIRYTFNNADGHVSWNDFLSSKETPSEVLAEFAKIGPKFMLQNLVDLRLFALAPAHQYNGGEETMIQGVEQEIAEFIIAQKG